MSPYSFSKHAWIFMSVIKVCLKHRITFKMNVCFQNLLSHTSVLVQTDLL